MKELTKDVLASMDMDQVNWAKLTREYVLSEDIIRKHSGELPLPKR